MNTKQEFYHIWGNEISKRSVIWLDARQLADVLAQGYECERITGRLTEASQVTMHQSYGLAVSVISAGHGMRYHWSHPVTVEWRWHQHLTDLAAVEMDKVIMLVEDVAWWIIKHDGGS